MDLRSLLLGFRHLCRPDLQLFLGGASEFRQLLCRFPRLLEFLADFLQTPLDRTGLFFGILGRFS